MNREVHYIFSIQTQYYLKSAWERGRLVYLMLSPTAQCQAGAGRNFSKSCCKRRQSGSQLSQQSTKHGRLDQKEGRETTTTTTPWSVLAALTFELSTETKFTTTIHTRSSCWSQIFLNSLALHFHRTCELFFLVCKVPLDCTYSKTHCNPHQWFVSMYNIPYLHRR